MCICSHKFWSILPIYNEFLYRVRPPCTWHCSLTYCWRDPELVKKSFPTSLQIKGFLHTKNLQLLLNEVLLLKCFSPISCFRSYGRFAINIIISHVPHRCMVSGWYVFLGTAKRKISQDQAMYVSHRSGPSGQTHLPWSPDLWHFYRNPLLERYLLLICSTSTTWKKYNAGGVHVDSGWTRPPICQNVFDKHRTSPCDYLQNRFGSSSAQCLCSREIKGVKWGRCQMVKDTTTTCDMSGESRVYNLFLGKKPPASSWFLITHAHYAEG